MLLHLHKNAYLQIFSYLFSLFQTIINFLNPTAIVALKKLQESSEITASSSRIYHAQFLYPPAHIRIILCRDTFHYSANLICPSFIVFHPGKFLEQWSIYRFRWRSYQLIRPMFCYNLHCTWISKNNNGIRCSIRSMKFIHFTFNICILFMRFFLRVTKYKHQFICPILIPVLISGRYVSVSSGIVKRYLILLIPDF